MLPMPVGCERDERDSFVGSLHDYLRRETPASPLSRLRLVVCDPPPRRARWETTSSWRMTLHRSKLVLLRSVVNALPLNTHAGPKGRSVRQMSWFPLVTEFQIPNSGFQLQRSRFQIANSGFQIPDTEFWIPNSGFPRSGGARHFLSPAPPNSRPN